MARLETSSKTSESSSTIYEGRATAPGYPAEKLLTLLGDSYTQQVLAAIGDGARTGRQIIERAGVSKATAYRRLDELQDAGIVDSNLRLDPDGHHCEEYSIVSKRLCIDFDQNGFDANVESVDEPSHQTPETTR